MPKTLQENLARQLCDSVDRLQKQAEKVEFWASAVTGLAQPVPDYDTGDDCGRALCETRPPAAQAPPPARRQPERQAKR